jgi:hypothetical protein
MKGLVAEPHEAGDIVLALELEPLLGQDGELDLQRQDFAVDQDAVAIENDRLKQLCGLP